MRIKLRNGLFLCATLVLSAGICLADDNDKVAEHESYLQCQKLYKDGKYKEAAAACSDALKRYPKGGWAYLWRSKANAAADLWDEAVKDAEESLKYVDNDQWFPDWATRFSENAASIYFQRGGHVLEKSPETALADFTRAIELEPNQIWHYFYRAEAQVLAGKCAGAQTDYERFLDVMSAEPLPAWAMIGQGRCLMRAGDTARAREIVRRLVELDPRLAVQYGGDKATDIYDRSKRLSAVKEAAAAAGDAEKQGNIVEAFQHLDRARGHLFIGTEYPNFPDFNKDEQELSKELKAAIFRVYAKAESKPELPESARRFAVQAEAATKGERYDDALALYDKALKIVPWWPQGNYNSALIAARRGLYQDAISDMKAYLTLVPTAANAREAQDKIYEWEPLIVSFEAIVISRLTGDWVEKTYPKPWTRFDHRRASATLVSTGPNRFELRYTGMEVVAGRDQVYAPDFNVAAVRLEGSQFTGTRTFSGQNPTPVKGWVDAVAQKIIFEFDEGKGWREVWTRN